MKDFFAVSPGLYPAGRIEWVLVDSLSQTTNRRWGSIVRQTQIFLALLLLFLHLAVFGTVGWMGYREIGLSRAEKKQEKE
ncbi:hypothetical protein MAMC_02119 [Methylacidimicrobium cyclopophantes]|uniref:Uncharacterized protein n=1 Tax=Methylacidimicrobium cyclopophantes TaxID=1041766 RepID=A0A5E6MFZ7_9BACT|nr:hypothetical protein MAMC_02119 [Methylacidimicrobium cyclopophantes]